MRDPELTIDAPGALERVRASSPLVHCITNGVVMNFTANVLLAAGAAPAMVELPGEAGIFAGIADAALINLGTLSAQQMAAIDETVDAAAVAETPWVLDPVAIGVLPIRTRLAHELAGRDPSVIRGNASELLALAGAGTGGRGADTTESPEAAVEAIDALAASTGAVIAASGPTDIITDGAVRVRIGGGSELLTRVTGGGCGLGAIIGAFVAARAGSVLEATAAAHAFYSCAAERAAATADGPGSFSVKFLDALATVQPADLASSPIRVAKVTGDA